jgi:protein-S-isoprenylcysteine O-methyltransferase Ste14
LGIRANRGKIVRGCFGTFLINGTWLFFLFAFLTVLNLHYQILHEERFLAAVYGHSYQAYCDRTARYWTWRRVLHPYGERAAG